MSETLDRFDRYFQTRYAAICRRALTGESYVEIGREFDISGSRVGQIVKKHAATNLAAVWEIGLRVRPSLKGINQINLNSSAHGVLTGFGRKPDLVRVRRDGYSATSTFHKSFWEPVPSEETPR